jgi:hypothetical protein
MEWEINGTKMAKTYPFLSKYWQKSTLILTGMDLLAFSS